MNKIKKENEIILYKDENGLINVNVLYSDEDLWITEKQLSEIYNTSRQNINLHINNIFKENELNKESVCKDFLLTASDNKNYNTKHYNLDIVIAVGYRVQSEVATRFRTWATKRLHEYIQKGFTMDDERLKQGGNRYFKELLQRIRNIRSSERNFYQTVTDIYATSIDYDPRNKITREFFETVQNKMHYAVHEHTAAEIIYKRVDSDKPLVGMTNFKGNYVTQDDVVIAKNYFSETELDKLNLLVSGYLDYAELQALELKPMKMIDWVKFLDNQIISMQKNILIGNGTISHKQAIEKAEKEYKLYREKELKNLVSDFDLMVNALKESDGDKNGK